MTRVLKKRAVQGRIIIERELCKGCRYCIAACPKGAIAGDDRFNSMGYFPALLKYPGNCTGCATCARMCPEIAIEVWKEEK